MAPISQNIFSDAFQECKFCILITISLKFVPKGPIDNRQALSGLDNGSAPKKRQGIIWTNTDPIHWRIYAALGEDELFASSWAYR